MKILSGRTEISIFEVSCSSTGCKSSAELMLFWVLSGYISSSGTLHFSHLSISSSAELWEFSAESLASFLKKAKLQMDVWSKIPSFFFFFSALKKIYDFWECLLLTVCAFLKENEIIPLNLQWTEEDISSGSSVEFGNCLFPRVSGQVVRWFHLKKTSFSLEHIFSHIEKTAVIFIVLGFLSVFVTFGSYFNWYLWHDKALVCWGIQWVIITAIIF